jgi:hypothetical protein
VVHSPRLGATPDFHHGLLGRVLLASVVAAAVQAQGYAGRQASPAGTLKPASAEIEAFVRQALEDRLAAGDLPDIGLMGRSTHLTIRRELPKAGLTLGRGALPGRAGYEFELMTAAEAQSEASRTRRTIPFISVDEPVITGNTGTIWLGADLASPDDPTLVKLCCCEGKALFKRTGDHWTFVKWDTMQCS